MAWLATSIELVKEADIYTLEFEAINEPSDMAEFWSIETTAGRILWSSAERPPADNLMQSIQKAEFSDSNDVTISGHHLLAHHLLSR